MKKVLKETTYLNEEIHPFQLKRLKQGLGPSRAPQREGSGAQEGYRLSDVSGKEEVPSRYEELDDLTSWLLLLLEDVQGLLSSDVVSIS